MDGEADSVNAKRWHCYGSPRRRESACLRTELCWRDDPNARSRSLSQCSDLIGEAIEKPIAISHGYFGFDPKAFIFVTQSLEISSINRPTRIVRHVLVVYAR